VAGLDAGALLSQGLTSLLVPGGIVGIVLFRQQRAKMNAETRAANAAAEETTAKASALLNGDALALFTAAQTDAREARAEARTAWKEAREARTEADEARDEAAACRRTAVELWATHDATNRHIGHLEAVVRVLGGVVPERPRDLSPQLDHPDTDRPQ
jgi:hypothetical protein